MARPHRQLMASRRVPPTLLLSMAVGCSGGGSGPAAGGAAGAGDGALGGIDASALPYEPCAIERAAGRFEIELGEGFTRVGGAVFDAVATSRIPDELAADGECRLLKQAVTSCDPVCAVSTEACDPQGRCVPLPRTRDVGTVSVRGMVVPLTLRPNEITRRYSNPAVPPLPHPGFAPAADLRIQSGGGDYAPFELRGFGVEALVLGSEPIDVRRGQPVRLEWLPPGAPTPARVNVDLNINLHGATQAWIECDFPDTGSAEIPASLIDGLFEQGLTGNPTLVAVRRSATSTEIEPGCVDLLVYSEVSTPVQVEGIVTCRTSSDCLPQQMCLAVELFCQ